MPAPPKLLGIEQILKADDLPTEDVAVPEWGGTVRVRGLTGRQRDAFFAEMAVIRDPKRPPGMDISNATARLVAKCLIDEDDNLLISDPAQVVALGEKSGAALDRVFSVCQRLSGLSADDMEEVGKVSEAIQSDGSTSG